MVTRVSRFTRVTAWLVGWAAATVLAAVGLDPIIAAFVGVAGLVVVVVAALGSTWAQHPSFEERELARARKRAAARASPRAALARDRDRARWAAAQARRAAAEARRAAAEARRAHRSE